MSVQIVKEWAERFQVKPIKTLNRKRTSYAWKHLVEGWAGEYVSYESFIEAMHQLGFSSKPTPDTPNFYFNISESAVKKTLTAMHEAAMHKES